MLDRDRQEEGQGQGHGDQGHDGQKLAQHQADAAHRQGEQDLQRPGALLLAPLAHGQRRDQEDHQDRHPAKERPDVGDVAREKGLYPKEGKERDDQKGADKDQRHRRAKVGAQLFAGDGPDLSPSAFHAPPPSDPSPGSLTAVASSLNTVSSVRTRCAAPQRPVLVAGQVVDGRAQVDTVATPDPILSSLRDGVGFDESHVGQRPQVRGSVRSSPGQAAAPHWPCRPDRPGGRRPGPRRSAG